MKEGLGLLKGMMVTARNFFGSYVDKERLTTVQYPEEGTTVTSISRNFPFLVYDGSDPLAGMRCTSCKICEKECPPQCIYIIQDRDDKGKLLKRPKVFDIDFSVCMGCQVCVEVCPFESIKMDSAFELARENRFEGLLVKLDQLLKSNDYYHKIHPEEAREVDRHLAIEVEKKKAAEKKAAEAKAAAAAKSATSTPAGS